MTLICPVLNLILKFQNVLQKHSILTYQRTFRFPWNSDKTFTIAFLYKIFNKSIYMDDNRCFSWYQSFGLGPFIQPEYGTVDSLLCNRCHRSKVLNGRLIRNLDLYLYCISTSINPISQVAKFTYILHYFVCN